MNHVDPQHRAVGEIFAEGTFSIPIYQRAYAWTDAEVQTLLRDVRDARERASGTASRDYYLGTLVVNRRAREDRDIFEVVDGQQRLTTLFILLALAKHRWAELPIRLTDSTTDGLRGRPALLFEGRAAAEEDLRILEQYGTERLDRLHTDGIRAAADCISTALSPVAQVADASRPILTLDDIEYLLEHVKLLRSELPPGTDLNHYFEVMNTRGEQLEKHEVLKANLMSMLPDSDERDLFAEIWDACSVMDRHLQLSFPVNRRSAIFGSQWNDFTLTAAEELRELLHVGKADGCGSTTDTVDNREVSPPNEKDQEAASVSLLSVLMDTPSSRPEESTESTEGQEEGRFGTIIDFPNLLLHVLRIILGQPHTSWAQTEESVASHAEGVEEQSDGAQRAAVRLDDKELLGEFARAQQQWGESGDPASKVWRFCYCLLRTRWLLDTYVIRTQPTQTGDEEENWVLQRAFRYTSPEKKTSLSSRRTFSDQDGQPDPLHERILAAQSMFQVTDTRRAGKYFLFRILTWLNKTFESEKSIDGAAFLAEIEKSAWERLVHLGSQEPKHENGPSAFNRGTHVHNFLFNVLDYVLWRLGVDEPNERDEIAWGATWQSKIAESCREEVRALGSKKKRPAAGSGAKSFRFRYRTSVEHFYPQHPDEAESHEKLAQHIVDQFGNLCVMSRSDNARRSNLMPGPKAQQYASGLQSLKFQLMAARALDAEGKPSGDWEDEQIAEHGKDMTTLLAELVQWRFGVPVDWRCRTEE
ncbi:DUF262 domain-containing HNH endonuclease family protein [Brachybacterium muris]|uniref:DUF262 domain-containing HNH endonuclease family protein n=1 Tax=Brachybacterium muris TaxID=219301 RepID=UPI00223BA9E3|nr:DUF262 domain-containing HNH endonuclease family protein [Brachybacterium muris]MCT1429952.1 DUF262 domain-containing HNH endonuclease family protein [Brachybacterium muris]MCT2177654.1 DUF262 domain-containing HNH endonuclease family protein [Brachybacterium muris]